MDVSQRFDRLPGRFGNRPDASSRRMPSLEKCIVTGVDQLDLVLPRRHFAGHVVHHRGQQQRCRFEPLGCPPPMS
jgi:hypothetical protein